MTNIQFEIPNKDKKYHIRIRRDLYMILAYHAEKHNTTKINVLHQILYDYFKRFYGFQELEDLNKELERLLIPNRRSLNDILASLFRRKKRRQRRLSFRKGSFLPTSSTESGSSDQNNP